jgi:hypothetical protein
MSCYQVTHQNWCQKLTDFVGLLELRPYRILTSPFCEKDNMQPMMQELLARIEDRMNTNAKANQEDLLPKMNVKQA